ncbi:MAG: hypothetical protein EHM35_19275 [Planctomycetaceae bacterium]|nr:MAG: hypothetical protein EHM35_19275 [Planctomycetaceae bacterium]
MRATTLKKKYPEMWRAVEDQVVRDLSDMPIAASIRERTAHNAAFVACSEHHKAMKEHKPG